MTDLSGKSVLVTGADGFIGSHLAERLVVEGCHVTALALYNSFGSHGWLDSLDESIRDAMRIELGDVRDSGRVMELSEDVEVIFHLAALIAIPYSYQAPESFVDTNVRGTLNVLEAARRCESPKVIVTSTSEVYGTPDTVPITVAHPLKAQSPYAATKIAGDQLSLAYAASFGVNALVLRPFNTYGPRQSMRAVIPTVLAQMLAGVDTVRLGSLGPKRDFTYVDDTVVGFVQAAVTETVPGEVIQLGTGSAVSVGDVVEICREITGSAAEVVEESARLRPDSSEVQVLLSDPSQALTRLDWAPSVGLEEGLRRTASWIEAQGNFRRVSSYHR